MITTKTRLIGLATAALSAAWAPAATAGPAAAQPHATLAAFADEQALERALARWRERAAAERAARMTPSSPAAGPTALLKAAPATAAPAAADAAAAESITNVQTAGVDEGGIVKHAGDHLVILRRGRLFTVRVGGGALQPVAAVDAFAPGSDPRHAWYDELLVERSTVVVVGYSYARGGTEIGLFALGGDGSLQHRATWHLRSFDYWSSRNYASRLVDGRLVFYTPTPLHPWGPPPSEAMPALRRWPADTAGFRRILPATRIHRSSDEFDPREALALHTVTSCEIGGATLRCDARAVLGPAGRVFYVSSRAVYVWTAPARRLPGDHAAPLAPSAVFRLPLDGGAPSALRAAGMPLDPLSFLEDADGWLHVLLRERGGGDGMWGAGRQGGGMALLRVPVSAFGDGDAAAGPQHYRRLPTPGGGAAHNRFVGDWLLWGGDSNAYALPLAGAGEPAALAPGHRIERIEALGSHALLAGSDGADLVLSSVRLDRGGARVADRHREHGVREGETRTHGFFHRAVGEGEGLLGLPVADPGTGGRHGVKAGAQGSAAVLFLRQRDLVFEPLGRLDADPAAARDDGCKASCVDWYGNARPIFLGGRIFALLGYELVEGRRVHTPAGERIEEQRRTDFAPGRRRDRDAVYWPFGG